MAGLVPAIHVLIPLKSWMPGTRLVLGPAEGRTRVPGMTAERFCCLDYGIWIS
jgi:hypothetical protein